MFNNNLPLVLTVWMMVLMVMGIARQRKHTAGVGLVLAFLLNMWVNHWAASLLYVLPWYAGYGETFTILGTEQSLYAVAAFAFGSLALAPFLVDSGLLPRGTGVHHPDPRLPRAYLFIGAFSYILLSTTLGTLPTLNSIISAGQELTVVGLGLCWWQAWRSGDSSKMALWLGISLLPPFFTIITRGFIGYGAVASLSVLIFLSNFVRSRVKVVVVGALLAYIAMSVYVSYMRDRNEIRATVWGGQSLSNRFDRLEQTASTFEWFDPFDQQHLARVDSRLNQSYLLGAAVSRLNETGDFARGETLWDAVIALVPRFLWPDKTVTAGSGHLVSRFTGISFASGTSVGLGQVMEFYVNFGTTGVIFGFMVLGVIITALDMLATERLARGDLHGFVLFYLPGLSFLQVGGQLVEITASIAASIIVALIANRYLDRLQRKDSEHDPIAARPVVLRPGLRT
jgi:hypothetical protein